MIYLEYYQIQMFISDQEFIAADLTLYSNPLNKALSAATAGTPSKPQAQAATAKPQNEKEAAKPEKDDMVAADLTKYDSPLSELDRKHEELKDKNK